HGEARCGGASLLPSSLSLAAALPVASLVVSTGESVNTSIAATSEAPNAEIAMSSERGEVVDIIEPFMKRPRHKVHTSSEASTNNVTIAPRQSMLPHPHPYC
ncbi:hypothetical protein AZE42_08674, partial [Rhizopogon vesiculosus]